MEFNLSRFFNLMKRDFYLYRKPIGLFLLAIFLLQGIMMFLYTRMAMPSTQPLSFLMTYPILIGGLLFTSINFWEFRTHFGRHNYLTIPASHFEKILTHLLYTTIFYLGIMFSLYWIGYHFFGTLLNDSNSKYDTFEPFRLFLSEDEYKYIFKGWFVVQAFVFVCSIVFNRFVPIKTFLLWFALLIMSLLMVWLTIRIMFFDHFEGWSVARENMKMNLQPSEEWIEYTGNTLGPLVRDIMFYTLPPFLWIVSYFKLTEKEA